jgi:hypothetical protein
MFKLLGVLVIVYTIYAGTRGEVFAKSGPWGRLVSRDASPRYFWTIIVIYTGLGIALLTIF